MTVAFKYAVMEKEIEPWREWLKKNDRDFNGKDAKITEWKSATADKIMEHPLFKGKLDSRVSVKVWKGV